MSTDSIRTPDQRLRVFISSTMRELASERAAARAAIERMHLHPVLFEMGARPHPPRTLYRAYLEQSDVFVGIFWESYGWVPPNSTISGLEDEFALAESMPRLIYVKEPAPGRDPRLGALIDRISASGASFRMFATPDELAAFLSDDLAVLLTERFQTDEEPAPAGSGFQTFLPAMANRFVGRERELEELERMLESDRDRLISLTGPGGIGKSRLALELGHRMKSRFADGAHLVILETIREPDEVPSRIASSLNLLVRFGSVPPLELLKRSLSHREMLLILDNFEQVLPAAPAIAELLPACPGVRIVVTTRALLRLRGEREYSVTPLTVPGKGDTMTTDAMSLFLERAHPSPVLNDPDQLAAVAEITRRLEGLPLALELAAARTSILAPTAIVERLDDLFGLLRTRQRDLPERQRTMRTAIAWSADLLNSEERALFRRLSVFAGGFDLEAAAAVCCLDEDLEVVDRMQNLVEVSLVRQFVRRGEPRFRMFVPIREYAMELLEESGERTKYLDCHADHFLSVALDARAAIRSPRQIEIFDRLDQEDPNIRRALNHLLGRGDANSVSKAGWILWFFWWGRGRLVEGLGMMKAVVDSGRATGTDLSRARAIEGVLAMFIGDFERSLETLNVALDESRALGDLEGIGYCQTALGLVAPLTEGTDQMLARMNEAIECFGAIGDEWGRILPLTAMGVMAVGLSLQEVPEDIFCEAIEIGNTHGGLFSRSMAVATYGWRLVGNDDARAARLLKESLEAFVEGDVRYGVAYEARALAELAKLANDPDGAARLLAFGDAIRDEIGSPMLPVFEVRMSMWIEDLKAAMGLEAYEGAYREGLAFTYEEGVEAGLALCERVIASAVPTG